MQVEKRTLNWFPKESAWDLAQAQRDKRKAISETYISETSTLASTIASARDSQVSGMAELATRAALSRITGKTA